MQREYSTSALHHSIYTNQLRKEIQAKSSSY